MALEVTDKNFEDEVLKNNQPVLVDFWAPWCGPCQMMAPIVEEVSKESKNAKVVKVNVDENQKTAQEYNIMSIPTLVIFKDGAIAKQIIGVQSKEVLLEELKNIK